MSKRFYTVHCGCNSPHAVTKPQRAYAMRSLDMAYTMRDNSAIAKIKDALGVCPSREPHLAAMTDSVRIHHLNDASIEGVL